MSSRIFSKITAVFWSGRKSGRGVALILTIMVVALLSASVISFIRMANLEAKVAENNYCFTQAQILAEAGLKGAMTILAMDDPDVDSYSDLWAGFAQAAALTSGLFEEGSFTGSVIDLSGRLNVNALWNKANYEDKVRVDIMDRLFEILGYDPEPIAAMVDWMDPDDDQRSDGGAESSYYMTLDPPYSCANGPFNALGELSLVKGMTPEMLNGQEDAPGILKFLTVHSSGKVNINTADKSVLMSLDEELHDLLAQEIIERRTETPFERVDDLKELTSMTAPVYNHLTGRALVDVKSSHFMIVVEGTFREARVVITAVAERDGGGNIDLIFYRSG